MAAVQDLPVDWSFGADDAAFDAMYRQYRGRLIAFCRSRLANVADAEDACQEAFLRAYRAGPRFDRAQRQWPWLATIAANVCTDMRRRRRAVPLSACDTVPRARTVDPDHDAEVRAKVQLVGSAIRDLPETYGRPLQLADLEGWSYQQIAVHERRSVASVRSSLMRGRVAFKERVQALAEERGMWPLAAVLPFPSLRLRARMLAWRLVHPDVFSSTAASAFSLAQAAVATLAVLSTVVPEVTSAGAGDNAATGVVATGRITSTSKPAPATDPTRTAGDGRVSAPPETATIAKTSTDVELEGQRRSAYGDIHWDGDSDGEREHTVWLRVDSDCEADPPAWSEVCEHATAVIDRAVPLPLDDGD